MQALILAGGQGSRLRPLTINIPKPIVPIANHPFLLHQIEAIKEAGISDIIISLNYQPAAIKQILGDGTKFGVNLHYVVEPCPMGTAGAYKFAESFLSQSTVVLNGDILTDIKLQKVIQHHRKTDSLATIVLTEVENPAAYGLVELNSDSEILRFIEKPDSSQLEKLTINTINAGIYILEPKILSLIPAAENYSFEYQLFPNLLERREKFTGFIADDCYWLDIGTPQRYLQAHQDLLYGKFTVNFSKGSKIGKNSFAGDECLIKNDTKIANSFLGEKVTVESNVTIRNSVIWSGTHIRKNAKIYNSIIGCDCRIGENSVVENEVLADKTSLAGQQLAN